MKRNLVFIILLALAAPLTSFAAPPPGSISNADNPHNMSSGSSGVKAALPSAGGTDQICVFCHTPHSASPKSTLWSRPDPDGPTGNGTFPIYAAALIAGNPGLTGYDPTSSDYPSGASRMCLSCHDGQTAIGILLDNQIITMETAAMETVTDGAYNMIVDLSTSHPISFNYNQNVVLYIDPLETDYQVPAAAYTPLDGAGQMQCTTCHDPHNDTRGNGNYGSLPFWRHNGVASSYDDVCNSCHKTSPLASTHTLP